MGAADTTAAPSTEANEAEVADNLSPEEEENLRLKKAMHMALGDYEESKETKEAEVAMVVGQDTTKWSVSVFLGSAIGFGIGFLFAKLDGHCCNKRQSEYASLLGN